MSKYRIEKDSMGEVKVPEKALYRAQTQRAYDNFPISGIGFHRDFLRALGYVKQAAARVNGELGLLDEDRVEAISQAADELVAGKLDSHFVVDIFQTGSGTSTNMNANEVLSTRASALLMEKGITVHPNDHVNFGQSSNDVIPTAIRVAAVLSVRESLLPSLLHLEKTLNVRAKELSQVVKTGRTHLMDAMPVTLGQVLGGYARQIELGISRLESALERVRELPQGGTAVGTGINTHPEFGKRVAEELSRQTSAPFVEAVNHFEAQSTVDAPVELSGQLKTLAVSLMKLGNDMRWMNSGPNSGLGEVELQALQPGSSIMPGKVNPVIEESLTMVCAQVIGNDATITVAGQSGNFELNVMLPVVAHNLLESIRILANAAKNQADRSVATFTVREERLKEMAGKNPILVTALNPLIGYDLAAKIAKKAYAENRAVLDVADEMTDLSREELERALDPIHMTRGGFME
ncbi:MAG: class II fumarate hydratase [Balneolaceae bacterium]